MRRRRRASATAGVAALVVALVVGLAFFDNDPGRKTPSPAPLPLRRRRSTRSEVRRPRAPVGPSTRTSPTRTMTGSTTHHRCRAIEPRATETAGYLYLTDATVAEAKKQEGNCAATVRSYMSLGPASWIPWGTALFLPSRAQVAEGASGCAATPRSPQRDNYPRRGPACGPSRCQSHTSPTTRRPSFKPASTSHPPRTSRTSPARSCTPTNKPGRSPTSRASRSTPPQRSGTKRRKSSARTTYPEGVTDVSVTAVWDAPEGFEPGNDVGAVCFFFHTDGTPYRRSDPPRAAD